MAKYVTNIALSATLAAVLCAGAAFQAGQSWQAQAQGGPTDINGIFIDPNGNVGVGTNTPTSDLHVRGNVMTEGQLKGQGHGGRYNGSVVFGAANTLGNPASMLVVFDEANFGKTPQAIQIMNPDAGVFKTFVIDHPTDESRYLLHATLEGPEGAVYYRGSGQLVEGRAEVKLPSYFEALTKPEDRTIQLTNVDGFDRIAVALTDGNRIKAGTFVVASDNPDSTQKFDWEVKAVRKDKPDLEVEPLRSHMAVSGFGPYKIGMKQTSQQ